MHTQRIADLKRRLQEAKERLAEELEFYTNDPRVTYAATVTRRRAEIAQITRQLLKELNR